MGEIDEWEIKRDTHNETLEYYNDMRKLIIITNFLDYFVQQSDNKIHSPAQKSEEFICNTMMLLKNLILITYIPIIALICSSIYVV